MTLIWSLLFVFFASTLLDAKEDIPEDYVVVRCQPGVFKIYSVGRIRIDHSSLSSVNRPNLEKDFSARANPGESKASFFWRKMEEDPERYLIASATKQEEIGEPEPYASGTTFAVSREGIFITNAHVVADLTKDEIFPDVDSAYGILGKYVDKDLLILSKEFGEGPLEAKRSFVAWYVNHCEAGAKFAQSLIVLDYDSNTKQYLTLKARVLAKGAPVPGKDVAVLQAYSPRGSIVDGIICLSLGSDQFVLPQTRIHALGFPGGAFVPGMMDASAKFTVSSQNGEIGGIKSMTGGWAAYEMTADINHGDSGGPVVDGKGDVVAISVAGTGIGSHTLAVPVVIVREYLKQAGLSKVDPGPMTATWVKAVHAYSAGRYGEVWDLLSSFKKPEALKDFESFYVFMLRQQALQNSFPNGLATPAKPKRH